MNLRQFLSRFEGESHYYANASHAFYDLMLWLQKNRLRKKPNIIMPVYIPAKLYRFVLAAGYEPKFYDVHTNLDFKLAEIEGLIDDQTQAVFAVHFFGVPVDMAPLKKLTQQRGIYLIEDCSHIMNSSYKGKLLGSTGDFTLFSVRKMLLLHCGGMLVLNTKPWAFKPSREERVSNAFTVYHLFGSRIKFMANKIARGKKLLKISTSSYDGYINLGEAHHVTVKQMDAFTRLYCSLKDLDKMREVRRENFQYLLNGIKDLEGLHAVGIERYAKQEISGEYKLNDGFVPFSMPILVPAGARNQIQKELLNMQIISFAGWPEAPFGLPGFEGAKQLSERLLELPVHMFVDHDQLERMLQCLNDSPALKEGLRFYEKVSI